MAALEVSGRTALVTGGARGIGLETARALHRRGAAVAVVDLEREAAERAAAEIGERALGLEADVTDVDAIGAAVETTVERFGRLDICVANAGISPGVTTIRAGGPALFERVIEVNLLGAYRTLDAALPHLIAQRGHLALVASIYAFFNGALQASYAVSKAGVEQLGRALRIELVPHGVSVGVAYYGFIQTEMVRQGFDVDPLAARIESEMPRFVRRRLTAEHAGEALARGIERRAARTYAPGYVRRYSLLRGILNPLIDRRLERRRASHDVLREADVAGRLAGREVDATRAEDRPPHPETR